MTRLPQTCKACRTRKIKCDRRLPVCGNCRQRSRHCTYAGERRTRREAEAGASSRHRPVICNLQLEFPLSIDGQQVHQVHPDFNLSSIRPERRPAQATSAQGLASLTPQIQQRQGASPACNPPLRPDEITSAFAEMTYDAGDVLQMPASSNVSHDDNLLDTILEGDDVASLNHVSPGVWLGVSEGDEYTGPSAGVSTVSDLVLNWVRENVPNSDVLCDTIQNIRNVMFNHLWQPRCMHHGFPLTPSTPGPTKEVPESRVLQYVEAYFSTVQVLLPILDRDQFLHQLATWGTDQASQRYSWKALLNAVLASGCRAALSDETTEAFQISGREAWGYFQNALACESHIIHGTTDLVGVQAMAVMTVFAQGLSSPQRLEYTFSSIASRLAQSIDLHHRVPLDWNLTEAEKRERGRVFWVIYCLDKTIALRCGRPSIIHDDEVSCCFPRDINIIQKGEDVVSKADKVVPFDFFLCYTKLSRICGNVSQMLYSATAMCIAPTRLVVRLNRLLQDLESWLQTIPSAFRPGRPLGRMINFYDPSREQIIALHSSYYYVLCAIYRRLAPVFTDESKTLGSSIDRQSHLSQLEAARNMVLLTKYLDIESFAPTWLVFFYPLTALTTIFISVVSNAPNESTQSDIALMETVVGFFGRLEYITSGEAAFTKMTEFVQQARNITARSGNNQPMTDVSLSSQHDQMELSETVKDGSTYNQPISSASMMTNGVASEVLSSQAEEGGSGQHLESGPHAKCRA